MPPIPEIVPFIGLKGRSAGMLESEQKGVALILHPIKIICAFFCALGLFATHSALADELFVVVGANSKLQALDKSQVRNIFLGKIASLPDGNTAVPVDQPESSPLREEFYQKVTNRSAAEATAYWAQLAFTGRGEPPRVARGSADVKKMVNSTPGAIGYIEKSALDASVKVLLVVE
jgi:ABC-type phosphate transport system substrate-binding protein